MADNTIIYEIGLQGDQYLSMAKKISEEVDRLTARQKILSDSNKKSTDEYVLNTVAIKDNKSQLSFLEKQISQNNAQQQQTVQTTTQVNAILAKEAKTINELRNQNAELLKIKNNLILTNDKEKALAIEIDKRINQNTDTLKANVDQYTAQKMNIGNYKSALEGLAPGLRNTIQSGIDLVNGLKAQKAAMMASTVGTTGLTKGLQLFKIALISTGIGALVVALGTLVAYFSKSNEGMEKLNVFLKAAGAVTDVLVDRLIKLGEIFSKIFTQSLTKTLGDIADNFSGIGDEIQRDVDLAIQMALAMDRLEDQENDQIVLQAQRRKMIEENRFLAKDELLGIDKRVSALRLAQELERANLQESLDIARQRAEIAQQEFDRSQQTDEKFKALQETKAGVIDLETESLKLQRSMEAELQGLLKKGRAAEAAASAAKLKELEAERLANEKKLEELRTFETKYDEERLEQIKTFEDKKRELENEIALQNATTAEEKALLQVEQDYEKQLIDLENLRLTEQQKTDLLVLMEEERSNIIKGIKENFEKEYIKKTMQVNEAVIKSDEEAAQARADVANALTGIFIGLLGDSLGAKLAGIAIEAAMQAGLVAIDTASASARNLAMATAVGPPQNAITIPIAVGQNAVLKANSTKSIIKILSAAAFKSFGTIVGDKFAEGGLLAGPSHAQGGIKTPFGELEGGEAVINRRSMANPYLRSLASQINQAGGGVKFADGGMLSKPANIGGFAVDYGLLGKVISENINSLKVINVATDTIAVAGRVRTVENRANV